MTKFGACICLFVVLLAIGAQAKENRHQISLQAGNWNGRYIYPTSDLSYVSKVFRDNRFRIRSNLRGYGSWYLLTRGIYEAPVSLERILPLKKDVCEFFLGGGVYPWLRLLNGPEFHAQPFLLAGAETGWRRTGLTLFTKTRFYYNGVRLDLIPQGRVSCGRFNLFIQPELSFLSLYNLGQTDRRMQVYAGLGYSF